jgi:hypothetical protein
MQFFIVKNGESHAGTSPKLRMLRQAFGAGLDRRAHLFLRVHVLRIMRAEAQQRMPQLRRCAGGQADSSGRETGGVSRLNAAYLQARKLPAARQR